MLAHVRRVGTIGARTVHREHAERNRDPGGVVQKSPSWHPAVHHGTPPARVPHQPDARRRVRHRGRTTRDSAHTLGRRHRAHRSIARGRRGSAATAPRSVRPQRGGVHDRRCRPRLLHRRVHRGALPLLRRCRRRRPLRGLGPVRDHHRLRGDATQRLRADRVVHRVQPPGGDGEPRRLGGGFTRSAS